MTETKRKVFVAVPAYGLTLQAHTAMSLFRLGMHFRHIDVPAAISTVSFPDIVDVRNLFLTLWYDNTDASHLLFIDGDMDFESQLVVDMLNFDKPVVGTLYPARTLPTKFVGRAGDKDADPCFTDGHIKVDGVGCGIMLIRRDAIKSMLDADPTLSRDKGLERHTASNLFEQMGIKRIIHAFDQIVVDGIEMSEDLSFCQRWKALCGGEIWANIVYEIGHTGPYRFAGRYSDLFKEQISVNGSVREQIQA